MRSFASLAQKARDLSLFTIGTIGTCITYVITVVLIKIAPHTSYRKDRSDRFTEDDVPSPDLPAHGDRTIRFAIFLYKKSWIRSSLIRSRRFRCRFVPSCSDYAVLAVRKYGLARGLLLIGDRFRRCGPSDEGDYVDFP